MMPPEMRERLNARRAELQEQFEHGSQKLDQLEEESRKLRETLLRISGAIQVLSEELGREQPPSDEADAA